MPGLEISAAFFASALLLGLAPGPDNIFVLTQSALFGVKAGVITTLGLVCGLFFHTLAVALGVAALLAASPLAFFVLKCFGAMYLCWLAWLSLRAGASKTGASQGNFPGYPALYRRGIIMNVTNPKVCLFFLAFLPQFCNQQTGSLFWQIVYFGVLFQIATIVVFCPIACLGGRLASWFNKSPKAQIILNRLAALVFLGLALALVLSGGAT